MFRATPLGRDEKYLRRGVAALRETKNRRIFRQDFRIYGIFGFDKQVVKNPVHPEILSKKSHRKKSCQKMIKTRQIGQAEMVVPGSQEGSLVLFYLGASGSYPDAPFFVVP